MQFLKLDRKGECYEYTSGEEGDVAELEIYYDLGGSSMWGGAPRERGIYVRVLPVKLEKKDGYTSRMFTVSVGSSNRGGYVFLKKLPRRNMKEVEKAALFFDRFVGAIANQWLSNPSEARRLLFEKAEEYQAKSTPKKATPAATVAA